MSCIILNNYITVLIFSKKDKRIFLHNQFLLCGISAGIRMQSNDMQRFTKIYGRQNGRYGIVVIP